VKHGFIAHSQNQITMPAPVQMVFNDADDTIKGDCHIKTAYSTSRPFYCVKIASGFYQNPALGLPVNNGLVMLFSSETGQPLALFQDDGHLTSIRTAAAGALGVRLREQSAPIQLGIVGTGHQAELQARWISFYNPVSAITVWGRSREKAQELCIRLKNLGVEVTAVATTKQLCDAANVLVTTTPSTQAIISASDVRPGHHIVAMGSDSPGKVELDPAILGQAEQIVVDDFEQCLHHGEFGHAVRNMQLEQDKHILLGSALAAETELPVSSKYAITVVDLTGLGAQDLAVSSMVWMELNFKDE